MKYKIGDKVRIVKYRTSKMNNSGAMDKYLGVIMTISGKNGNWYKMKEDNNCWFWNDDMIEGKVEFTKSDLKDGDIVTYRNGKKRTKIGNKLVDENGTNTNWLTSYNEDLTREYKERKETDIIKAERPIKYETVFERKEEILDEAEKKYLSGVIRPFKEKVDYIRKEQWCNGQQYITLVNKKSIKNSGTLPVFDKGTMYKNMQVNKDYTLEELRIIRESELMKIEEYLSTEEFKTRQQLVEETGMIDRAVRNQISILKKVRPVIYNSQTKGYRLAKDIKKFNTAEEAREEFDLVQHCINDIEARKRNMNMSERTYIAYQKKLEEEIMILENEKHIPHID